MEGRWSVITETDVQRIRDKVIARIDEQWPTSEPERALIRVATWETIRALREEEFLQIEWRH